MLERLEQLEGQRAMLTWMAFAAIPSMSVKPESTKKLSTSFMDTIKRLMRAK